MIHRIPAILAVAATAGLASAQSISTLFLSNAGSSSNWLAGSVSFDVDVVNPAGLSLNSLQVNAPYPGVPGRLELYTTDLGISYNGNIVNPAVGTWKLRSTANFVAGGSDTPVSVTLDKPVHLATGLQGVTIVHRGCGIRYTSPGSSGTPLVYTNSDLTLTNGAGQSNAFVSTPNTPRIANVTLNYTPAFDLVDFAADVISGPSPLSVNFYDRSAITSGTVIGYEWDFENDGIVDSNLQNPTAIYATCGTYSPKLRVLTTNGPVEYVWSNLVTADPLSANFTASATSVQPQTAVQFTDTSVGAQGWLWDFENDGIVDSTLQNPSFTFGAGSYDVKLTVTNGCGVATKNLRIDAVTDSWSTTYNGNFNLVALQGLAFFDLNITSTEELIVTGLDVNTILHQSNPCPIKVWLTETTAAGKQTNQSYWREVANGNGIAPGGNVPTRITLDRPILLLPGRSYGVAVHYLNAQPYYLSPSVGALTGPDFVFTPIGVSTATTPFSSNNTTRQFIGGLHYTKAGSWPVGSITPFAPGCAGTLGVPEMKAQGTSRAKLGTTFGFDITNAPIGGAFVLFGFSNQFSGFGQLPLDLGFFGAPGCFANMSADTSAFAFSGQNTIGFTASLPNAPALAGIRYYAQSMVIDPTANALGGVMSDAVAICTGVY